MANRGINKVILIGYLGQNPELRYMSNGNPVVNMTLATSDSWRDKQSGEVKEKTEWHKIVIFGKLAEIANEYLRKGSQVYLEGSIQTRKWQDQNGQDRYTTEIIVGVGGTMQMLSNKHISNESTNNHANDLSNSKALSNNEDSSIDFDDDIPF